MLKSTYVSLPNVGKLFLKSIHATVLVYLKFILILNGRKSLTCLATMFVLFLSLTLSNSEQC